MSNRTNSWILLTTGHLTDTMLFSGAPIQRYVIAPTDGMRKGDVVYLWWNIDKCFFAWGTVVEAPMDFIDDVAETKKRRRQAVLVETQAGFNPRITEQMMLRHKNLKDLIPKGFDDLVAIKLRPAQAGYLNDYIRERNLDAPPASTTTSWLAQENAPIITIQTILTLGDKTQEGRLVEGVRIAWDEIIKRFAKDPEEIYRIDPRLFEEIIAGAYKREGYEVELTPRSGDKGRDVVATKHGLGSIRIFDQVKRYKISRPVTADEVRALVGVISMAPNVSKGVITTTSTFAPTLLDDEDIRRWVPHRLELRPRSVLLPWLEGLRR